MRLRLLPATIGVASVLLASKAIGLVFVRFPDGLGIHEAVLPAAEAASATEASRPAQPHAVAPPAPSPGSAAPKPSDPPLPVISEEERRLLQDLRTRKQEWEARDRTLSERQGVLNAAEQRVIGRAAELAALQAKLEQLEKARAERDDANWSGLVKVYETMKPREAAAIFNEMDMPVLLQLVDRMKEPKAALIFGAMQPDRARLVTAQLAAKRSRTSTLEHLDASAPEGPPRP